MPSRRKTRQSVENVCVTLAVLGFFFVVLLVEKNLKERRERGWISGQLLVVQHGRRVFERPFTRVDGWKCDFGVWGLLRRRNPPLVVVSEDPVWGQAC